MKPVTYRPFTLIVLLLFASSVVCSSPVEPTATSIVRIRTLPPPPTATTQPTPPLSLSPTIPLTVSLPATMTATLAPVSVAEAFIPPTVVTPSPTDTTTPTDTPLPTAIPIPPTYTPQPTAIPTSTQIPTSTPTLTPSATPAPSPTATPTTSIDCGPPTSRGCLKFISPQLADFESANPFVFFDKEDKFKVEYTNEAAHNDAVALKITFKADHPNYGGWGIGQLPSLDVTGFSTVSFYLKGTSIGQTFEFKLKDMDRNEKSKDVTVESDQWTEITFALNQENFPGVNLSRLENINLGFNDGKGNATIYVDDFAFK